MQISQIEASIMYDPNKHTGIGFVVSLIDNSLKGIFSTLGVFSIIFFTFLPMIGLIALIKWLFVNGYIG